MIRRRDVRNMAEVTLTTLLANYNTIEGGFDQEFLTEVRDLMRLGESFVDIMEAFLPDSEAPENDVPDDLSKEFITKARDQMRKSALPKNDGFDDSDTYDLHIPSN